MGCQGNSFAAGAPRGSGIGLLTPVFWLLPPCSLRLTPWARTQVGVVRPPCVAKLQVREAFRGPRSQKVAPRAPCPTDHPALHGSRLRRQERGLSTASSLHGLAGDAPGFAHRLSKISCARSGRGKRGGRRRGGEGMTRGHGDTATRQAGRSEGGRPEKQPLSSCNCAKTRSRPARVELKWREEAIIVTVREKSAAAVPMTQRSAAVLFGTTISR
jgi:hypothetical protein